MQTIGLKRNTIDKFYTKNAIIAMCIQDLRAYVDINHEEDLIIEPSAGNGAWIDAIKSICDNHEFYDITPEHDEIICQNFYDYEHNPEHYNGKIIVLGNPPFGRQASAAMKFIKKSATFCDIIAFVLPRSFKKNSFKNKIPEYFHLLHEKDIDENAFYVNDTDYNVPCVFQIWERRNVHREKSEIMTPHKYIFVKKDQDPDIAFRRVGVYCGKISQDINNKSIQSHYFIKFDNFTDTLYEQLENVEFECRNNTVGAKSISKQELIAKYNIICQNINQ